MVVDCEKLYRRGRGINPIPIEMGYSEESISGKCVRIFVKDSDEFGRFLEEL